MRQLLANARAVRGVAYSPDGKLLASCGMDKAVRLWDAATGSQLTVLKRHEGDALAVEFSPDGKTLASGGRSTNFAGVGNSIRLWDVAGQTLREEVSWPCYAIHALSYSADGSYLAAASRVMGGGNFMQGSEARCWWFRPGGEPDVMPLVDRASAVRFAAGVGPLVIACMGAVNVYKQIDATDWLTLRFPNNWAWGLAVNNTGETIAATAEGETIHLWYLGGPKPKRYPLKGLGRSHRAVAFSPDGRLLAAAGFGGAVRFWDAATRTHLADFDWNIGPILALAFAPDGLTMAAGGEDGLVIFDVEV